jgi:CRISPR/Cas system-associated exonuclease Cas4 (RecB family)
MSTIRASEIGTYVYCKRAWWYQKQGHSPENQQELAAGTKIHVNQTRKVWSSGCLRIIAYALFITAIILFVTYLTGRWV